MGTDDCDGIGDKVTKLGWQRYNGGLSAICCPPWDKKETDSSQLHHIGIYATFGRTVEEAQQGSVSISERWLRDGLCGVS